jgi:hypothetical protein
VKVLAAPEIPECAVLTLEEVRFDSAYPTWDRACVQELSNWYWYQYEPHLDTIHRIKKEK